MRNILCSVLLSISLSSSLLGQEAIREEDICKVVYSSIWRATEEENYLRFDSLRIWIFSSHEYRVLGIDSVDGRRIMLTEAGRSKTWAIYPTNAELIIIEDNRSIQYEKVDSIPKCFVRDSVYLGNNRVLSDSVIREIQVELASRKEREQNVRIGLTPDFQRWINEELVRGIESQNMSSIEEVKEAIENRLADTAFIRIMKQKYIKEFEQELSTESGIRAILNMRASDSANTNYIRSLVTSIGWIDVARFGEDASYNAGVLVQHSGDPLLMSAVLPELKKDGDCEKIAMLYPLMYFRMCLYMGVSEENLRKIKVELGLY